MQSDYPVITKTQHSCNGRRASILVDIHQLRIGMYIVLDLGWLSHPFPVNRFRIARILNSKSCVNSG
jgi:hypothetical protein